MRVLIIGAGGHAQVIADILLSSPHCNHGAHPIGYLDDNSTLTGQSRLGLPILGPIHQIDAHAHDAIIIGIGHNETRKQIHEFLRQHGEYLITARHASAVIGADVAIGDGCSICAGVIVAPGSRIGHNVILNTASTVDHHSQVGDHVHIAPGVHIGGDVLIGAGVLVGIGATVMPQRAVGAWAVVGAGALVRRNVPDRVTVVGVPARPIGLRGSKK